MSHDTTPAGAAARTSTVARRTTLIVLTLIATVQFFDRALMVVVMEPIKSEFALSDSQLGLLAGFSYAAAFALAGIPLGWVADRTNRRNLLALLLAVWSALVALAGSAGSFAALVATRVGIGAADAGGQPCSVSTIADLYPRDKRAGAVAVFYVGVPLGMLLGFMAGASSPHSTAGAQASTSQRCPAWCSRWHCCFSRASLGAARLTSAHTTPYRRAWARRCDSCAASPR